MSGTLAESTDRCSSGRLRWTGASGAGWAAVGCCGSGSAEVLVAGTEAEPAEVGVGEVVTGWFVLFSAAELADVVGCDTSFARGLLMDACAPPGPPPFGEVLRVALAALGSAGVATPTADGPVPSELDAVTGVPGVFWEGAGVLVVSAFPGCVGSVAVGCSFVVVAATRTSAEEPVPAYHHHPEAPPSNRSNTEARPQRRLLRSAIRLRSSLLWAIPVHTRSGGVASASRSAPAKSSSIGCFPFMYGRSVFCDLVLQHAPGLGQLASAGAFAAADHFGDLRMIIPLDGEEVEDHAVAIR